MANTVFQSEQDFLDALDNRLTIKPSLETEQAVRDVAGASYDELLKNFFTDQSFVYDLVELCIAHKSMQSRASLDPAAEFSFINSNAAEFAKEAAESFGIQTFESKILSHESITKRYSTESEIGIGGMGKVFFGRDRTTNEQVAIKALRSSNPTYLYKLKAEFRTRESLGSHPAIVSYREIFVIDDEAALVMEFVDGHDFSTGFLKAKESSSFDTKKLLLEVAQGLNFLHKNGIIHLDIKPANVLVREDMSVAILILVWRKTIPVARLWCPRSQGRGNLCHPNKFLVSN